MAVEKYCLCKECFTRVIPAPLKEEKVFSIAIYEGPVKEAIHTLKYGKRKWIALSFARWMNNFINEHPEIEFDMIIPVPLHPVREFLRSFNQSWLMAHELGKIQKKPAVYDVVVKQKNNRSQTDLSPAERKENVRDAFKVKKASLVRNKIVLIVDDVYTTGATVEEVQKTLNRAGAKKSIVLTIART